MPEQQDGGWKESTASNSIACYIDLQKFSKRLKLFYDHWKEHRFSFWGGSDAIAIAAPPAIEDIRYLKSSALNIWLLGYEFRETIMVFLGQQIHFLCSQKDANVLGALNSAAKEAVGADTVVHVKDENDNGANLMETILHAVFAHCESYPPIVGHIRKELPEGELLNVWFHKLNGSSVKLNDVTEGLFELLAVKDGDELTCVKKAACLTMAIMESFVVPKLVDIIEEHRKISHASLADDTEETILDPQHHLKINMKLKAGAVDICYPPIFQSGGKFDPKPTSLSNDDDFFYDSNSVIICALGTRYSGYCTNIARTYFVDATSSKIKAYETLLKAHNSAIAALKPGNKISAAFQAAVEVVQNDAPEFLPNFTKSAGSGIGLEFRESGLIINSKNNRLVKTGMVFNVAVSFCNLEERMDEKTNIYSLLISDTVIVGFEASEVLTSSCSKSIEDVYFDVNEVEEVKQKVDTSGDDAVPSQATHHSENREISEEELQRQHQGELVRQKNEEVARMMAGVGSCSAEDHGLERATNDPVALRGDDAVPSQATHRSENREISEEELQRQHQGGLVRQKNEEVARMMAGAGSCSAEDRGLARATNDPVVLRGDDAVPSQVTHRSENREISVEELRRQHQRGLVRQKNEEVARMMAGAGSCSAEDRGLARATNDPVASRESETAQRAALATQETLQLAKKGKNQMKLHDLWVRPMFGNYRRNVSGTLIAHPNGFRYYTSRADERVDILYENIKHALFQPLGCNMTTLLHFRLHNYIVVGCKTSKDVQFQVRVMDAVRRRGGCSKPTLDRNEIEERQLMLDCRKKIDMDFRNFVNMVESHWAQQELKGLGLKFEVPRPEHGFRGVFRRASAFIIPASTCLVQLVEAPFLVVTLSEIEIVNLERVMPGHRNFDMVFVFKDLQRNILHIDSIPSCSLDAIKKWLEETHLKYYETRRNMNWNTILSKMRRHPKSYIENGGWDFLNMDLNDWERDTKEEFQCRGLGRQRQANAQLPDHRGYKRRKFR